MSEPDDLMYLCTADYIARIRELESALATARAEVADAREQASDLAHQLESFQHTEPAVNDLRLLAWAQNLALGDLLVLLAEQDAKLYLTHPKEWQACLKAHDAFLGWALVHDEEGEENEARGDAMKRWDDLPPEAMIDVPRPTSQDKETM